MTMVISLIGEQYLIRTMAMVISLIESGQIKVLSTFARTHQFLREASVGSFHCLYVWMGWCHESVGIMEMKKGKKVAAPASKKK